MILSSELYQAPGPLQDALLKLSWSRAAQAFKLRALSWPQSEAGLEIGGSGAHLSPGASSHDFLNLTESNITYSSSDESARLFNQSDENAFGRRLHAFSVGHLAVACSLFLSLEPPG